MIGCAIKRRIRAVNVWLAVGALLLLADNALAACPTLNPTITHRLGISYCELCGVGEVTIRFTYPGNNNPDLTNLIITEDLGSSGLTYIPGTTTFAVNNGPAPAPIDPSVSGPNGSVLTWNLGNYILPSAPGGGNNTQFLDITFQVRRADSVTQEGLVTANRTIVADISYETINEPPSFPGACSDTRTSGPQTLPLREPLPQVIKRGRNVDANQTSGQYSNPVYGHNNDDVIWRIEIRNNGLAGMQDLRFDDLMQNTDNLVINYACPTEAAATAVANNNGVAPGGSPCIAASNTINNFIVTAPFGNGATSNFASPYTGLNGFEVDVTAGGNARIYLVGKITANGSCVGSRTNTVSDVQWGCGIEPPAGGISATSTGSVPSAQATLITRFGDQAATLTVNRQLTGTNTSQPVGSKGTMTITITNNTGGTVKNIRLADVLPPEYVMDSTFTPTASMNPAYNPYPGMIDNITWDNPAPGTFPLTTTDPLVPLTNTNPAFTLTSQGCSIGPCAATVHPIYADQRDMMRRGDVLTIRFRVVLIRPASYDKVANLDVRTEVTSDGTDPTHVTTLTNTLTIDFDTLCSTQGPQSRTLTGNGTATNGSAIPANPEDLDVDIVGTELIFILTNNPLFPLPLTVALTNNGGHDAADYRTFVSFGTTMEVVSAPSSCAVTSNPPPLAVWTQPAPIPGNATIYECTGGPIAPGQTVLLNFQVIKTSDPARIAADDLTFRADVVGEITLSDGTPLWFPAPTPRPDGITDRANNYTLDGIRARVIGFNLLKSQVGTCTENNPPPATPDNLAQIGEDCTFHIETGGWFGFQTPGFSIIAVQRVQVVDELPDGQGFISSTDPFAPGFSTSQIQGVSRNPSSLAPLDEGFVDWTFNQIVPSQRITERDHWFRVNISSRLLNDPVDLSAPPNQHAALSRNILNSIFQAVFFNDITGLEEVFDLGQNTVGYPPQIVRRFDLTVTEPQLIVTKEVCNETLYGVGPACSNWTTLADDGDAFNSYIYRLTVTNEAASAGVTRAPAYDVVVTDLLDASDLAFVLPFASDGLDNDGDAGTDEPGAGAEGSINDNVVKNGTPAEITFSYTHSTGLQRIDPGQSVQLYYRVDYDDDAAPLQTFTNTANTTYDSLAGPSGNQSAPQRPNSDIGGARVYQAPPTSASVRIIPVLTQPKRITQLSNTPPGGSPQPVSIGEEIEYELVTSIPVALLRNFTIRDELPVGIRCSEAPIINLNAPPYAAAGFIPGGTITPTCTDTLVEWNFGDQRVTQGTTNNRYDFAIRFIARVENTANTNEAGVISNGGAATNVTASYIDETNNLVTLTFGQVDIVVREPRIDLTKAFAVTNADAADVLTVTVTATNSGTATAYDLRVLDDLTGSKLTFLGNLGGADPPDNVDTSTLGANQPIFSWNLANPQYAIAPGQTRSFTFEVRVDTAVQPLEVLDNTLQARWTSLPSQNTALNSSGAIGADGSDNGMRNGALPNAGDAINDYETTATAAFSVPAVTMSKTDLSPATVPTIGAHKNFQIEIRLPEGMTNDVIVTDDLATTGLPLSYWLENNSAFDISYTFEGIASINGQPPSEAALLSFPADNTSGIATWNIGTVVTATENDTVSNTLNPVIRISYYVRVNNDLVTDAGDTLQNGVVANYTNGETGAQETLNASTPLVVVLEPQLTLSKTLANVTVGKLPGDPPVAGDILEYRLVAANTGNSTAFDVNLVDSPPIGVVLDPGFTPTATINATPVAGFVATPAGAPAGPLVWGRGNGDGSLDLPAGQTLILTYRVQVQVIADPNGLIENGVLADWTSLDDVSPYERTGAGCPNITLPNDYCVGPVVASTTGIRPVLEFRKTVINVTTGQNPGANASPGDILRYRVQVRNVSAAPLNNFSVVDDLDQLNNPPLFVPGTLTLVSVPPGADTTNTNPTGGIRGTGLVDIRNLSVGVAGSGTETVVVEFDVQLVPVIVNGTLVLNQAQLVAAGVPLALSDDPNVNGPDDPQVPGDEDPTQTVITSAPTFLVQKISQDLTGDPTLLFAGDTLRYTITVKNVGNENAVNVSLQDAIPANTTYVANSTTLNGAPVPDTGGTTALQGGMLINAPEDLTPGAMRADPDPAANNVATIVFDVTINAGVPDSTVISNQGFVNGTSASGTTLPVQPSDDPATAAVDDPTLDIVIQPNGIVYDAVSRQPLAGVTLRLLLAATGARVPDACFNDPAQQDQVTTADGYYKFDLNFSDPVECPPNADYLIAVTAVPAGYEIALSQLVPPPSSSATTPPYSVPLCPADAILATSHCEAQASDTVPVGAAPTTYYLHLTLDNTQVPQDSQIFNNHIPIDPELATAVRITKTTPLFNVTRASQVPYTITIENTLAGALQDLAVVDTIPPGFKYVEGSGRINGVAVEPITNVRQLTWGNLTLGANEKQTIQLLLVVGSGVSEGEYVNSAQVFDSVRGGSVSGVATATVQVVPDPTFDCTDVIGKVFDDANLNGYQDKNEKGLGGVRVVSARGLLAKTDEYGRFHITCAVIPNETRGSNFILKLDDRTLPTGYRLTTENPLVHRATRGKAIKFNFGAALHRVVRLDVADGVFEPGSTEVRPQWRARIDVLLEELRKSQSILRISYLADVEDQAIVKARVRAVKGEVAKRWAKLNCCYQLTIETEIFWRRGGPPAGKTATPAAETNTPAASDKPGPVATGVTESSTLGAAVGRHTEPSGPPAGKTAAPAAETNASAGSGKSSRLAMSMTESSILGAAVERHAEADVPRTQWVRGEESKEQGDKVEVRQAPVSEANTVKLQNVVPPIRFGSGEAEIPEGYTETLRDILNSMKDRANVRLHLVGHTDNVPLAGEVKEKYGDNRELSRERAGTVAEYFQRALNLPPESISYEGVGDTQPIASNETENGKALNRRVEVEVWYDRITEKMVDKEVVVAQEFKRVKVCRVETVCKLRYKEGHAKRARIKNLIPPLHFDDETTSIPGEFLQNLQQALTNLRNKQNVVVKFIGYTDNLPLTGRAERIYGTHEGLSKARARRASLAVQDALKLPTSALDVTGKGAAMPLASNDTEKGRALNRRIEVEFWYDDALQDLPDEPQVCPEAAGAETVTRVYDPPSGAIPPILYDQGKPVIPEGYAQRLSQVMGEVHDRTNVRLRFIGYTANERLERRTALLYGDDVGLSTARARRVMEVVKQQLGLSDGQVEFEGRGYVQSNDVVNTGFIESDTARVEVQVVYDELAVLDDDSLEITRLSREVKPKDPFALNLMRITVDGKPLDDPGKSISDVERCTDVALEKANVQFQFDNLELKPRLNVTAWPIVIRYRDDPDTDYPENLMRFRMYTNYPALIERAEVRIFESAQSERDVPRDVIDVDKNGYAKWQPSFDDFKGPSRELRYVLRVYDKRGLFDETKAQPIRVVDAIQTDLQDHDAQEELLVGYGETRIATENIKKKGGTIRVQGSGIPGEHSVWVAGREVPVSEEGRFVTETMLPPGMHTVEVAVLDRAGNGELFLRDLELKKNDWFFVGIADITASKDNTNGPGSLVTADNPDYDNDTNVDGRLAFYTKGKFGDGWQLTASGDTLEGPVEDMFSNFLDKSPGALFRRIDPDYFYPTYGDDSTVEQDAPTLGKFYTKLKKNESYGLWGNFKINYTDNDLAHVDRGLYGANGHYESLKTTSFGEQRLVADGFAAEPGTLATRDEFLSTGGSLYFLRHQDILTGSERVRVEIRDKDSRLVIGVKNLTPVLDYDIDYLQGRIVLSEPLPMTADDNLLVKSDSVGGNPVFLVVRYEFTPGFDDIDTLAVGGRLHYWLNDHVKLGVTSSQNEEAGIDSSLNAADLTLRKSAESWIKLEASSTEGPGTQTLLSPDGGFSFDTVDTLGDENVTADAYQVEGSIGLGDFFDHARGKLTFYTRSRDAGYSAPGLTTLTDTRQYGGSLQMPVGKKVSVKAKVDKVTQDQGLDASAAEVDIGYQLTEHWNLGSGVRYEDRTDNSSIVPLTQVQGERTDVAVRATYDSLGRWTAYGYVQDTVDKTGNREDNGRMGSGGSIRVTDRLKLNGEVSAGDLGPNGKLGLDYLYSDRTNLYLNYVIEDETSDNGIRAKKGNLISGFRTRYSDSASVYLEERYTHGDVPTGLTHSTGIDLAPTDRWTLGAKLDFGTLRDFDTGAEIKRSALGLRAGYGFNGLKFATAFEYGVEETENLDTSVSERKTWLFKNSLKWQVNPSWRIIGKLNYADSDSSQGEFFDGKYTEAVLGYGYRPVNSDRLNLLFKYTYFYNLPTAEQVTAFNAPTAGQVSGTSPSADIIQKSHIAAVDVMYDVTRRWTIGGKYAYRLGQVSLDRVNPEFFDSRAHLYIGRVDWQFKRRWDALMELRLLDLPDAQDRRSGALFALYWRMGDHLKLGVGYNFTDFSDDLTDLDYDSQGVFINVIGKM